jgi:hypothetical protein
LKLTLVGQGDKLAWALMPSGQNGLRTSEFELGFQIHTKCFETQAEGTQQVKALQMHGLGFL